MYNSRTTRPAPTAAYQSGRLLAPDRRVMGLSWTNADERRHEQTTDPFLITRRSQVQILPPPPSEGPGRSQDPPGPSSLPGERRRTCVKPLIGEQPSPLPASCAGTWPDLLACTQGRSGGSRPARGLRLVGGGDSAGSGDGESVTSGDDQRESLDRDPPSGLIELHGPSSSGRGSRFREPSLIGQEKCAREGAVIRTSGMRMPTDSSDGVVRQSVTGRFVRPRSHWRGGAGAGRGAQGRRTR